MKIENRPMLVDFEEKKNPDSQLHQIFKLIGNFFCTFLPIMQFKFKTPLKQKKYKQIQDPIFFYSFIFNFNHFTFDLGETYSRTSQPMITLLYGKPYISKYSKFIFT